MFIKWVVFQPTYGGNYRNSDNVHNAAFIRYSLVAQVMADEHLIVVLHQMHNALRQ